MASFYTNSISKACLFVNTTCSLVILNLHWILLIDTLLRIHWAALITYCYPFKRRYNSLVEWTESFMMGFMIPSWCFTQFYYQSFLYFIFRRNKGGCVKYTNFHPSLAFRGRKLWLEAPRGKVRYFLAHFASPSSWPCASPQRAGRKSLGERRVQGWGLLCEQGASVSPQIQSKPREALCPWCFST